MFPVSWRVAAKVDSQPEEEWKRRRLWFPRIEKRYTQTGEVFCVPGDQRQIVFKGSRGNQSVRRCQHQPFALRLNRCPSPSLGNLFGDRQQIGVEPCRQSRVQPQLKISAAFPQRHVLNSKSNFSDRYDTGIKRIGIGCLKPADDIRFWIGFDELRNDVRIDEEVAQNSTGRG